MQDTELYRHLLGIEKPCSVAKVELAVKEQRVDVLVEHKPGQEFACPECDRKLGVYDHAEERTWRHLDNSARRTWAGRPYSDQVVMEGL